VADRILTAQPGDPVSLALALCHEIGNLLAASRLSAYLVARETEPSEIRAGAHDIETAAAQAGAILAHVRPLLAGADSARLHVEPGQVLEAVRRSVDQHAAGVPELVTEEGADLPDVRVDPDGLHHLLVSLVLAAWDASPEGASVRLEAGAQGGVVVLAVEDQGRPYRHEETDPRVGPRGRALVLEVAATLVQRWQGEVRVLPKPGGTRVELRLPAAGAAAGS
jgi:signal transduction histidine kinase